MTETSHELSSANSNGTLSIWGYVLLTGFVVLLPVGSWYNAPLLIMAVIGCVLLARQFNEFFRLETARLLGAVFLCIWVPMVIATVGAANSGEALRKTVSFLALFPVGVFAIHLASRRWHPNRLTLLLFAVVSLWMLDAVVQFLLGANLLGFPRERLRLTGVFYPKFTLGVVLAVLSPFFFDALRRLCSKTFLWSVLLVPYCLVIVLAGSRSSWAVFLVAIIGYLIFLKKSGVIATASLAKTAGVIVVIVAVLATVFPAQTDKVSSVIGKRVERTLPILQGDREGLDRALARRLSLWETARNIIGESWLTGVGPRGYRYVYADFAPEDDYFQGGKLKGTPTHPHQMFLEIAAESGLLGVLGYVLMFILIIRHLVRLSPAAFRIVFPAALALVICVFPLNVHHAFYGSFTSAMMCWLLAVFVGTSQWTSRANDRTVLDDAFNTSAGPKVRQETNSAKP